MKESKWADALRFAQTAVELDPSCKRYVEFIPLLEEKLALAKDEEEEDDDDTVEEGEDDSEEEETDDEEEEEEEDDEEVEEVGGDEEVDDEAEVADQDHPGFVSQAAHPDQISMQTPTRMSKQQRSQLRASLQAGIQSLKEQEVMDKFTSLDPLLGA
jgi:hypothetical protein